MVSIEEEIKEKEEQIKQINERIKELELKKAEAIKNLRGKDLEKYSCKVFVCPNINQIDTKGKELGLSEDTIEIARNIAIKYLKKTYHEPEYNSINFLVPAFLYITSSLSKEIRTQKDVASVCSCTEVTVRRWANEIIKELEIKNWP